MTKYNHITYIQRNIIQKLISDNMSFTDIGNSLGLDRTSIAKEIKRNRYVKNNKNPYDFDSLQNAVSNCSSLQRKPYCCNACNKLNRCWKVRVYYNAKIAQQHYEESLKAARMGIDVNPEIIDEIEHSIIPLIKYKKQSINQIYINHSDLLYFSKTTFYKYISIGAFSITDFDLPKKVTYKPRKKEVETTRRELKLLNGRKFVDFCKFKIEHPLMHIVQMDTVIGTIDSEKVLLTLFFTDTHFMLIRLLDKKNIKCVNFEINSLKEILGIKLYAKIFRIFLTDNGTEFFDVNCFEKDYNSNKKVSNIFFCDPHHPEQKGAIEKNHEFIRKVLPKGTSFDNLSSKQIKFLEDNINNIPRDSLNGKSPYELTKDKYPLFIEKIDSHYIHFDEVDLSFDSFNESAE